LAGALLSAACGTGGLALDGASDGGSTSLNESDATLAGSEGPSTPAVTIPLVDRLPAPRNGLGVLEFDGYAVPILQRTVDGWVVLSPCGNEVDVADGVERPAAHVVIDPEPAAAPIARAIERRLAESGVSTVLSRWTNVAIDASTRSGLADSSGAHAFVTLRLVAGDVSALGPAEVGVVHQAGSDESRRLGGLMYASLSSTMNELADSWPTLAEPGVYPLLNQRGSDFFVVLRETAGTASVVVDIPGLGTPALVELLATSDGQAAMAEAVSTAIEQFLGSQASGSGYVEPVELVRDAPTGDLGSECDDPLLASPVDE